MLESFKALYGKTVTVLWHFGNGADRSATSSTCRAKGSGRGNEPPATVYFNVMAAKVYRMRRQILNGRGVPFAVAGDVKILGPPEVIKEMAEGFPTLVWEEAGLTTQTVKNRIFVHASAQVRY